MNFLGIGRGNKRRKPAVLVNGFNEMLSQLSNPESAAEVEKRIREMLECLATGKDDDQTLLSSLLLKAPPAVPIMLSKLAELGFESRKEVAQIFIVLMQRDLSGFRTKYLEANPDVVSHLMHGYANSKTALVAGTMLRECNEFEALAKQLLTLELLEPFFRSYLVSPSFDVGSDAFVTIRSMMTRHKQLVSNFLTTNHDDFFARYNELLTSDNYVTQRQSLKLLGEILLDRSNFAVMMKYIGDKNNLKLIMNLLRIKSPAIQFEAFHVFKVFVANPKKPEEIASILRRNSAKLVVFLEKLCAEKNDEQLVEEKALLIKEIQRLGETPEPGGAAAGSATGTAAKE